MAFWTRQTGRHTVTLLTRAGCHLCDDAHDVLARIAAEAAAELVVTDVDADPRLRAEYGDYVPVFLVDDIPHGYARVDEARLRRALR